MLITRHQFLPALHMRYFPCGNAATRSPIAKFLWREFLVILGGTIHVKALLERYLTCRCVILCLWQLLILLRLNKNLNFSSCCPMKPRKRNLRILRGQIRSRGESGPTTLHTRASCISFLKLIEVAVGSYLFG